MNAQIPFRNEQPECGDAEAGYMLVAVIVMVVLVLIALSVAAPVVAKDLRRQKELESEQRAQQYVRAIRVYYRKTHTYPPSIDALKNTNNIRFLRQEYVDPLTGKSDWRILHLGEQKTTVKGFFGQELGGIASGGLGSAAGMSSGIGSSPTGATTGIGATSAGPGLGATGAGGTTTVTSTNPLNSGLGGAAIGGSGAPGSTGGLGSLSSFASTGSTGAGGGAIIGVGTARTGSSIATPNQQSTYETWEFWYDPRIEQLYQKGHTNAGIGTGALGSKSASSFGTDINGQPNGATGTSPGSTPTSTTPTVNTPSSGTTNPTTNQNTPNGPF